MNFFPPGFDPRADVVGQLTLARVNTPDGDFRFLLGEDGIFRDITGQVWVGARMIGAPTLPMSIGGTAPAGSITMAFFQDPDDTANDLINEVRQLGADYVRNRPITFFVQPLFSHADLYAPTLAPIQLAQRRMTSITFSGSGRMNRSMTLHFEGVFAGRRSARGWTYSTNDHAKLIGRPNPSLEFMPTDSRREEKLFG